MAIITLLFVFCFINCGSSFHGLKVDAITSAVAADKGSSPQVQAKAISTAYAFHGVEGDQVTYASKAVKGTASPLEANAKEIGTLFVTQVEGKAKEIAPQLQVKMDRMTSGNIATQHQVKAKERGTAINGHESPATGKYEKSTRKAMYITLSRSLLEGPDCGSKSCAGVEDADTFCQSMGCYKCPDDTVCTDLPSIPY